MKILYAILFLTALLQAKIVDSCMTCHKETTPIDSYHPYQTFGCASCHGGDRKSFDKKSAHKRMVLNPARLEHAKIFCVKCHKNIIKRIDISMMQTQNGILDVLKYQWKETKKVELSKGIEDIKKKRDLTLAEDHFSKLCAACHIDQDQKVFANKKMVRGGGCVDCHEVSKGKWDKKSFLHPRFSTIIPSKNCLKCHNRSNRIGLSYFGKFESEGYGTPYNHGNFTHILNDNRRYYYDLPDDIHHRKAGLDCIDCHTEKGVMGDGKRHKHMEDAEDVKCIDCHKPKFKKANTKAIMLSVLNKKMPLADYIAYTKKKNSPIYNLRKVKKRALFFRKRDGKKFKLSLMSDKSYHSLSIHKRLDCSACHSSWAPSCYGCHEVYLKNGKQYDWIKAKKTVGQWQEFRSFLRWEHPSLGIGYNGKVMPFAPGCQVIGSIYGVRSLLFTKESKKSRPDPMKFHSMAMAGWDPHTTQLKSRSCEDCHFNPASLGLGRGHLDIKKDKIVFEPIYDSNASGMPFSYPIDAFVSEEGKQFQSTSRKRARSFNKSELYRIVKAYKCIICHNSYDDKIYKDFNKSKKFFYSGKTKCLR